jgi:hypothetical protein
VSERTIYLTEAYETVRQVRNRQVIWTDWHKEATDGLSDDDIVVTHTRVTPFGRYLIRIERVGND